MRFQMRQGLSFALVAAVLLASAAFAAEVAMVPGAMGAPSGKGVAPKVLNPIVLSAAAAKSGRPTEMSEGMMKINLPKDWSLKPVELEPTPHAGQQDSSVLPEAQQVPSNIRTEYPFQDPDYPGISFTGWFPPDCHMACGLSHVILVVNSSWCAYSKTNGSSAFSPIKFSDWFADVLVDDEFVFDPKVIYDADSKRYVILAMSLDSSTGASGWVISASQTSDPTGNWWVYRLDATLDGTTPTGNWADFPGFGVDKSAVYLTANMFGPSSFEYIKVRILNKSKLYSGASLPWYDFWKLNDGVEYSFTAQAAQSYPASSYNYLVASKYGNGVNRLTVWKITSPTSKKPSISYKNLTVPTYSLPVNARQKGGPVPINVGDVRLLNAVIRNGRMYTAHTIAYNWGSGTVSAIRWYEIQMGSTPTLLQSGTYGVDKYFYYYPAIMPDASGNLYVVFNRSSSTEFVGIRAAGRKPGDGAGLLGSSTQLSAGTSYYVYLDNYGRNRWGDYNGNAKDPSTSGNVWVLSEYAKSKKTWATTFTKLTMALED